MEAAALLKKDHAKVKELFRKFEDAGDRAGQTKQRLFSEIKGELDVHTGIEEEIFYPAMQKVRSTEVPGVVRTEIWNAGRSRPDRFGGRQESPAEFAAFLESRMDPDEVGRIAVTGIEAGTSSS